MTCADCTQEIETREESCIQDKTGRRLCVDCADEYWDVTMCAPRGCSCSRGGNAITCECRDEAGREYEDGAMEMEARHGL